MKNNPGPEHAALVFTVSLYVAMVFYACGKDSSNGGPAPAPVTTPSLTKTSPPEPAKTPKPKKP